MSTNWIAELIKYLLTYRTTGLKSNSEKVHSPLSQEVKPPTVQPLVKEENGYYIWDKGVVAKLSPHFSTREMTCRCKFPECKEQRISKDLIERIEKIREEIGNPLIITSAYRCAAHQNYLRASGANTIVAKKSTHEAGDAVDAAPKSGEWDTFQSVCEKHFTSIGVSNSFLHLDTRPGVRRWKY